MNKNLILFFLLFTIVLISFDSSKPGQNIVCKDFIVSFYNVENLFDTIDDPRKNDNDFLPSSKKQWDSKKYKLKLKHLAQVLGGYKEGGYADIIGLCEIENKSVLQDLIKQDSLKKGNYSIIHYDSPDLRGIDVALLYRKKTFTVLFSKAYMIQDPENGRFKTRDILYVKGKSISNDTLHIFVNHWSSRIGGQEESEGKRELSANILRHIVDSILKIRKDSKIIIMGDFNDEPSDVSLTETVKAKQLTSNKSSSELYNLSYQNQLQGFGSYYYFREKKWNMLDNMIISGSFFLETKTNKLKLNNPESIIFKPKWACMEEKDGTSSPYKTYAGKYIGGYSDHFSIYTTFQYSCKASTIQ